MHVGLECRILHGVNIEITSREARLDPPGASQVYLSRDLSPAFVAPRRHFAGCQLRYLGPIMGPILATFWGKWWEGIRFRWTNPCIQLREIVENIRKHIVCMFQHIQCELEMLARRQVLWLSIDPSFESRNDGHHPYVWKCGPKARDPATLLWMRLMTTFPNRNSIMDIPQGRFHFTHPPNY